MLELIVILGPVDVSTAIYLLLQLHELLIVSQSLLGSIIKYRMLSERLCPPGTVSVYRSSPPLYPGGPAEQLNVVCVSNRRPIEAESGYFEHNYVYPFDRFKQDTWNIRSRCFIK